MTDTAGNTNVCSFTVTVLDAQKPVIVCPPNLTVTNAAGLCGSNVVYAISASDNCGVASTNQLAGLPSGSLFPVGVTTNVFRVADAAGNTNVCSFTVTVLDLQLPVITCPPDFSTNTAPGGNAVTNIALGTPVTSDNCAITGVSNNAPNILPVGTNLVLWTVTDASGNTRSCQQRVVVVLACSTNLSATPLTSQSVCSNQTVVFQTTASSPEPITYLWRYNGQAIAGQTNNSLFLAQAGAAGGGTYSVEVRTACAAVTNSASLTLLPSPTTSPASSTNAAGITINQSGTAAPYGSTITPSCVPGTVRNLTVSLFGFAHTFPTDVSVVLISPDGRKVKLMAGAGGGESLSHGVNLTFSSASTNALPEFDLIVSGTYRPTDYLPGLSLPAPAAGPYSTSLSTFVGAEPNGPWRLYVHDNVPLDAGSISGWSLNIEWQDTNLSLRRPTVLSNGWFQLEVLGPTGVPIIIQRSSNLVNWLPLATNVYGTIPAIFIDPAPVHPYRFYRAVLP